MMEYWNDEQKKTRFIRSIIPLFHSSNIPALREQQRQAVSIQKAFSGRKDSSPPDSDQTALLQMLHSRIQSRHMPDEINLDSFCRAKAEEKALHDPVFLGKDLLAGDGCVATRQTLVVTSDQSGIPPARVSVKGVSRGPQPQIG